MVIDYEAQRGELQEWLEAGAHLADRGRQSGDTEVENDGLAMMQAAHKQLVALVWLTGRAAGPGSPTN